MKTYEKPRLVALSLTSNDMLCGSCNTDVMDEEFDDLIGKLFPDVEGEVFSSSSSCEIPVEDIDKFPHVDQDAFFVS